VFYIRRVGNIEGIQAGVIDRDALATISKRVGFSFFIKGKIVYRVKNKLNGYFILCATSLGQ
jgi:hypothetical protein